MERAGDKKQHAKHSVDPEWEPEKVRKADNSKYEGGVT